MSQTLTSAKLVLLGGLFLLLDQGLKFFARTHPSDAFYIIKPLFGWEYFENTGIAFSLPFPQIGLAILTPIILIWLYHVISKQKRNRQGLFLALTLIVSGAVSNFVDRMVFGFTVDYIRIFTGVINVADVLIVTGVILMLLAEGEKEDSKL
jgi:signal peptidase II